MISIFFLIWVMSTVLQEIMLVINWGNYLFNYMCVRVRVRTRNTWIGI